MAEVRVLIVDDQEPFRRAMAAVVEETDGFVVVGSAASGEESLALAAALRPDLVLMDVQPPRHRRHRGHPPVDRVAGRARSWSCSRPTTRTSSTWPAAARRRTSPRRRSVRTGSQRPGRRPPAGSPTEAYDDRSVPTGIDSVSTCVLRREGPAHRLGPVARSPGRRCPCRAVPAMRRTSSSPSSVRSTVGGSVSVPRGLDAAEVDRRLDPRGEPAPRHVAVGPQGHRRRAAGQVRPERGLQPGPVQLGREHAPGQLAQRLQRGVRVGDQLASIPFAGRPRRDRLPCRVSAPGSSTRRGSTSREIGCLQRAAGGVVGLDDPRPRLASARAWSGRAPPRGRRAAARGRVLRKATAVWSARASSSRSSDGPQRPPLRQGDLDAAEVAARRARTGTAWGTVPSAVLVAPRRGRVIDVRHRERGGRGAGRHRAAGGLGDRRQQRLGVTASRPAGG